MRRLSELRLLHHFINNVSPTLPTSFPDLQPNMWATSVVDLALQPENAFLLHAVFAISALHWTVINSLNTSTIDDPWTPPNMDSPPDESKLEAIGLDLAKAHRLYLDLAVQEHRLKMLGLGGQNSDTMYLTSVLMLLIAMRMNTVQEAHEYNSASVQWRRMAKAMSMIDKSELGLLAKDAYGALNLDASQRTPQYEWEELAQKPEYQMMKAILEFEDDDSSTMNEEDRYAYVKAAEYVAMALAAGSEGIESGCKVARRIAAFPAEVPERFLECLEDKRPRAFAIFTHIMSCAKYIDQDRNWWLEGVAQRCKARIQTILSDKWLWALPKLEEEDQRKDISGESRRQYLTLLDGFDMSM